MPEVAAGPLVYVLTGFDGGNPGPKRRGTAASCEFQREADCSAQSRGLETTRRRKAA